MVCKVLFLFRAIIFTKPCRMWATKPLLFEVGYIQVTLFIDVYEVIY